MTEDNYVISAVPITLVDVVWPQCIEHIQRVVDRAHGEITLDSVKSRLMTGNSLLVTISKGVEIVACNILEVRVMDSGLRALYIPITGGHDLDQWMPRFLEVAKAIGKDYKCKELRGLAVRKGWMRVLKQYNWEEVHTVIKCDIEE